MEATNFLNIRMKALMLYLQMYVRVVPAEEEDSLNYMEVDDVDKDDFVAGKEAEGDANDKEETQDE